MKTRIIVALLVLVMAVPASAVVINLGGADYTDIIAAQIDSSAPNGGNTSGDYRSTYAAQYKTLLAFPGLSAIPAGATINSATITVWAEAISGPSNISTHTLLKEIGAGDGNPVPMGGTSWNDARAGIQSWDVPGLGIGVDYLASVDPSAVYGGWGAVTHDVTASLQEQSDSGNFYGWLFTQDIYLAQSRFRNHPGMGDLNARLIVDWTISGPYAFYPDPADGSEDVARNKVLGWQVNNPNLNDTHKVYLGEYDPNDPNGLFLPLVATLASDVWSYEPELDLATAYQWRVDIWDGGAFVAEGDLWNFTTAASVPECDPNLTADITGDCIVDLADFAVIASDWLKLKLGCSDAPDSPFGVNTHTLMPDRDHMLDEVRACGIGWIRIDVSWAVSEPTKGNYNWSQVDDLVAAAQARCLRIYASIGDTPAWATSGSPGVGVPDNFADFYDFCYDAAQRYRGKIDYWGMWNEANLGSFWEGSRWEYINIILKNGADAVHAGNPAAKVCGPELAHLTSGDKDWYYWLKGSIEQAGDKLDIVTHHVYESTSGEVTNALEDDTLFGGSPDFWGWVTPSVKEVLEYTGWLGKPFWLTETGWKSAEYGEQGQADGYAGLLNDWFTGQGDRDWIDKIFFYQFYDEPSHTWGIVGLEPDFPRKPAFYAYQNFIQEWPAPPVVINLGGADYAGIVAIQLDSGAPDAGNSSGDYRTTYASTNTTLLAFPGLSAIPAGSTINSATITVWAEAIDGPSNISTHTLLKEIGAGDGNPVPPGGTSWNDAGAGIQSWDVPGLGIGVDYLASVDPSAVYGGWGWVTHDVTASLQQQSDSGNFYGWLFTQDVFNAQSRYRHHPDIGDLNPRLTVDYVPLICDPELTTDISGPTGVKDCYVDIYDLAVMAGQWLQYSVIMGGAGDYAGIIAAQIDSSAPNSGNTSGDYRSTYAAQYKTLLAFPGLSAIPAGATINSATLTVYGEAIDGPSNISTHTLLKEIGAGDGNPVPMGGTSWNDARAGIQAWDVPGLGIGVDYLAAIDPSAEYNAWGSITHDVTASLQEQSDSGNFYGWLFIQDVFNAQSRYRHHPGIGDLNPRLVVDWTISRP